MEINIFIIIFIVTIVLIFIINQVQFFLLRKRINNIFGKGKSKDLEKVLNIYVKDVHKYFEDVEELKNFSNKLYGLAEKSIQKVGFIRFNPFDEVGGDQSFSISLLDLNNNGILITSLFGRDGTRIYSKPIENGQSKYHLSEEEKEALKKAIKK